MSTNYSNWVSCRFLLTWAFVGQFCSTMISGYVSIFHVQYYEVNKTKEKKQKHINSHELILIKYPPPPPPHSLAYPISLAFKHVSVSFCQREHFALLISNLIISPFSTLLILSFYFFS